MRKRIVFLLSFLIFITVSTTIYAKYVIEYTKTIANIQVDTVPPNIQLLSVENTNEINNKYANKTHTITVKIKITEKNIKENNFNKENVKIMLEENEIIPQNFEIQEIEKAKKTIIYSIKLNKLLGDGKLKIRVKRGTIKDISQNINIEKIFNTGIEIDNTAPVTLFKQEELEEGKVKASIEANEKIIGVDGWNLNLDNLILSKEFKNNVTYPFKITDYAGNHSNIDVNITKATNIKIMYGSLAEEQTWSFGSGNNEIAGKEAILKKSNYKTEMICLNYEGEIEKDFIQIQGYMYTHLGEGKRGIGYTYENRYTHGYNPSETTYYSMASGSFAYVNKKKTIILGGDGVNRKGNKGIDKGEAIPEEIAKDRPYGMSGLRIKLKDYSEYSIVYQIYLYESGWQKPVSDGELAMLSYNKPMAGYRLTLIPKTEKQYIIELWNNDIGTNNIK